jgi:hypothetical protein
VSWLGPVPPPFAWAADCEVPGRSYCRFRSGVVVEHDNDLRLLVVLESDTIVVTMPGASYEVTYLKRGNAQCLLAKDFRQDDDPCITVTSAEFLEVAWKVAIDKARELGWIV